MNRLHRIKNLFKKFFTKKKLKITAISSLVASLFGFFLWNVLLASNIKAITPSSWVDGNLIGLFFLIGFILGLFSFIWYPIAKLRNWLRTRKLRNKNLQIDLKIKEHNLQALEQLKNDPNKKIEIVEKTQPYITKDN